MSNHTHTVDTLRAFEQRVVESFKNKEIKAPVHLYYGNEEILIDLFNRVKENDWVFCSWRSHYQCLLKGVPDDVLFDEIKKGHSISLSFPEHRIFSSAIVGGNIPIALGVALANQMDGKDETVFCFVGDMTAETGCFHENYKYSVNYDLPIIWIIEDNGKSVCTDTKKTWNSSRLTYEHLHEYGKFPKIIYYKYETIYPHAGIGGARITF